MAIRLGAVVVLVLLLLVVGGLLALPRLLSSDAVRSRIEEAGREATGQEVRWSELDVGYLPPRLVIREPRLAAEPGAEPLFAADDVSLVVALAPLLQRTVVVESVELSGATIRLLRTEEGLIHPFRAPEEKPREALEVDPTAERPDASEGLALQVRRVALRGARIVLEDRTLAPPAVLELRDLDAEAVGESLDTALDFEVQGALASGGGFRATGRREHHDLALDMELDGARLAAATPYLGEGQRVAGAATGTVTVRRSADAAATLSLDVVVDDGEIRADELELVGRFSLRVDLRDGEPGPEGTFELDATEAALRYGPGFTKLPGEAATARGRLVPGEGGIQLRDTEIKVRNFEAEVFLETGARTRATLEAPAFELEGWGELVPALAELAPRGRLAIPRLELTADPLEFGGRIDLVGVELRPDGGPAIVLAGALLAEGDGLRSEGLTASVAEQELRVAARVSGLAGQPRFSAEVKADDVDTRVLLAALTGDDDDTLQGPLDLRGRFAGPLGGDLPVAETIEGTLRFEVAPGRLKGVSLLRSTFDELGAAGRGVRELGDAKGGRSLQRFYDDEFESLSASFALVGGRASTDDLRLRYRHYTVDLRGAVGLVDRALDLTGKLTIDPEIDETLAGAEADADTRARVIPLARISGTLDTPRVEVRSDDALRFAALYATQRRRDKLERKLDERLGEGAGRDLLDQLEGILVGEPR